MFTLASTTLLLSPVLSSPVASPVSTDASPTTTFALFSLGVIATFVRVVFSSEYVDCVATSVVTFDSMGGMDGIDSLIPGADVVLVRSYCIKDTKPRQGGLLN